MHGTTCGFAEFTGFSLNMFDTGLLILNPGRSLPIASRGTGTAICGQTRSLFIPLLRYRGGLLDMPF